ncbi:MAG: sulfite exporter TauE/SafE family protein [Chitinophagales bacterium]|nr:sulfite exporter TauE/SafE family protein [Bacteroidota bacterium]
MAFINELNLQNVLLLLAGGMAAGFINTLVGSGSAITLGLFSFMGLPSPIANGTNRIGVLVQSIVGFLSFKKYQTIAWKSYLDLLILSVAGAWLGAQLAAYLDARQLDVALGVLMFLLFLWVWLKPQKWLKTQDEAVNFPRWLRYLIFFGIGVYGGFIQAGVGVLIMAAMVATMGKELKQANILKLLMVLCFTVPSLIVFIAHHQVNFVYGIWVAIGQSIGAYGAAGFANKVPRANEYIRYLLLLVLLVASIKFLHFW